MSELRWLQLSDLHLGAPDKHALWPSAEHLILDDLKRVTEKVGPFDVVIFTGDLTFKGHPDQFVEFETETFPKIWDVVGGADTVLLAIPGNHDLEWPDEQDPVALGLLDNAKARDGLWDGYEASVTFVKERFAAYSAWWDRIGQRPQEGYVAGLLPGDFSFMLEKGGLRVGFVGLNSTWLQLRRGMTEGSMHVDVRQVLPACGDDIGGWTRANQLNFLLTHHPPDWLEEGNRAHFDEILAPPGRFTAHLFGHMHEARTEWRGMGGGEARWSCQAPSLFGLEKISMGQDGDGEEVERRHGYVAGRIEMTADGPRLTLWPRRGVKAQDGLWRVASDFSFHLENDVANVKPLQLPKGDWAPPAEVVPGHEEPAPATSWCALMRRSELWAALEVRTDDRTAEVRRLVVDLVHAAEAAWQSADKALPDDPWRDWELPGRTVERLSAYTRTRHRELSMAQLALLLSAPFLRSGILAAGAEHMLAEDPLDLETRQKPGDERRRLQREHARYEAMVRRTTLLSDADRRIVALRLLHHALRRWPALWRGASGLLPVDLAQQAEAVEHALYPRYAQGKLFTLARLVGGEPNVIAQRAEDLAPMNVKGQPLNLAELAYLLCVAGHAALDPQAADEAAVEHVGVDRNYRFPELILALRNATWRRDGRRDVLRHQCPGPVVDFVLRRFAREADDFLEVVRRMAGDQEASGLVNGLPERITAGGVVAKRDEDGTPRYRLPHIRFRLEHNRVRNLLMGEQLYGDPGLALREMYQNALDACRYRRARQEYARRTDQFHGDPYTGRIVFRQRQDDRGREYIECQDNGVGMSERTLERLFAVAGRRFHDSSEFAEENADWERIELGSVFVPNSQFGIGVLSYFMLADEIEIHTRLFQRDGRKAAPFVARISSAGGLFRLEGDTADAPLGTTVRLYLAAREKKISCREVMENQLWVAEFETAVEGAQRSPLIWPPDQVGPVGSRRAKPDSYLEVLAGEVWWASEDAPVLADGVWTKETHRLMLVNLRGHRYPKLSVDRKSIESWDSSWLSAVWREAWPNLVDWKGMTHSTLLLLEDVDLETSRQLFDATQRAGRDLPWTKKIPRIVPLKTVGCFSDDHSYIRGTNSAPNYIYQWRTTILGLFGIGTPTLIPTGKEPTICPVPGDSELLQSVDAWVFHQGDLFTVPEVGVTVLSSTLALPPNEVVKRAEIYTGQRLAPRASFPRVDTSENLASTDIDFLKKLRYRFLAAEPIRSEDLYRASITYRCPLDEIRTRLERLSMLNVHLPAGSENLQDVSLDIKESTLLSLRVDGHEPFMSGRVQAWKLYLYAGSLGLSIEEAVKRFESFKPFGVFIDGIDRNAVDQLGSLEGVAREVIQRLVGSHSNFLQSHWLGNVHAIDLVRMKDLGLGSTTELERVIHRMAPLGILLRGDPEEVTSHMSAWTEWKKLVEKGEGPYSPEDWSVWYQSKSYPLMAARLLLRMASSTKTSPAEISYHLHEVGVLHTELVNNAAEHGVYLPDETDLELMDAVPWERYEHATSTTIAKTWFDWVRFRVWWVDESELKDRIDRLAPLFVPTPEPENDAEA